MNIDLDCNVDWNNKFLLTDVRDVKTCESTTDNTFLKMLGREFYILKAEVGQKGVLQDGSTSIKITTIPTIQSINIAPNEDDNEKTENGICKSITVAIETVSTLFVFETQYCVNFN